MDRCSWVYVLIILDRLKACRELIKACRALHYRGLTLGNPGSNECRIAFKLAMKYRGRQSELRAELRKELSLPGGIY